MYGGRHVDHVHPVLQSHVKLAVGAHAKKTRFISRYTLHIESGVVFDNKFELLPVRSVLCLL